MPTLSVGNDHVFHYDDSGPIDNIEYPTFILLHGLGFHSSVFEKLLPLAKSHSLRIICPSRREYKGSTPYSTEEMKIIHHGSHAERTKFIQDQGVLIALCVDKLIQTLALPKEGGIMVGGWSMGNVFSVAMRAAIDHLPDDAQQRLKAYTRGFIICDPPSHALGFPAPPGGYIPLRDTDYSEEARGPLFAQWVSSYFDHGDLSSRDFSRLKIYESERDTSKQPSIHSMTVEAITDFHPAVKCEMVILESEKFVSEFLDQTMKAVFDPKIREMWGGHPVSYIYGDASVWSILYSVWSLEKKGEASAVNFKVVPGGNHFPMWDSPELFMSIMKECLPV